MTPPNLSDTVRRWFRRAHFRALSSVGAANGGVIKGVFPNADERTQAGANGSKRKFAQENMLGWHL